MNLIKKFNLKKKTLEKEVIFFKKVNVSVNDFIVLFCWTIEFQIIAPQILGNILLLQKF